MSVSDFVADGARLQVLRGLGGGGRAGIYWGEGDSRCCLVGQNRATQER